MSQHAPSGIFNIDKPAGITSHDVVNRVRKIVGIRRVGHAGTLDPMATGVLIVCVGQATRLIEYIMLGQKRYRATILFGQATDTYDAEGEVVAEADPSGLGEAMVQQAISAFVGTISQIPPPFSAIKRKGVPLYKLARQGINVVPEPRLVQIEAIEPVAWRLPEVVVDVVCQGGTYIRSLAHDLGQKLGVGAHLTGLRRMASGDWPVETAISLERLASAAAADALMTVMQPQERAMAGWPRITLSTEQVRSVRFGQAIFYPALLADSVVVGYDSHDKLVAILQAGETGQLKPKKVFKEI